MLVWEKVGVALEGDRAEDDARVLCPSVLRIPSGFRLFYMGLGRASPRGTKGRILSAWSGDGVVWTKEPGVRVDHHEGAEIRVLSPCVVSVGTGGYRMYFEAVGRTGSSIRSAIASEGHTFVVEDDARVQVSGATVGSPRALVLPDGRLRLYFHEYPAPFEMGLDRGNRVVSAVAKDGLRFSVEPGVRVPQTLDRYEREAVYAAQPVRLADGRVRVFYGAWNGDRRARGAIMTALSDDGGLSFVKAERPVIAPDGPFDATFASEPAVFRDARGVWRMVYEAEDASGATRLLSAIATS